MSQVPDHRFEELMQRVRQAEQENMRLRGTVDAMMQRQPAQPQTPPEESPFAPEVDRALAARFDREIKQRLTPLEQQHRQAFGALADQNDHLRFSLQYGPETYEKYKDKIERVREERSRVNGQWVSREDAFRLAYYDENGKKPAPSPATIPSQAQAPQVDPYTGMYTQPVATDVQAPELAAPQAPPAQQPAQSVVAQPPAQPLPVLPAQTVNPAASQSVTSTAVPRSLDVGMGSPDLDAWANKYGDIPL